LVSRSMLEIIHHLGTILQSHNVWWSLVSVLSAVCCETALANTCFGQPCCHLYVLLASSVLPWFSWLWQPDLVAAHTGTEIQIKIWQQC
jgi:hypothetical protein